MQLLWILSSAVEEPFRLPLKHCRGRSIRLVSNLQLWKMTFAVQKKLPKKLQSYFNGKTIDKIRSEFITNRQNHFEEGTLTHRQAKYGYALSEDRRSLVLNPESAQVVKLIFQMYLEDIKIPEIARALDVQGVKHRKSGWQRKKDQEQKISGRIQQFARF